jgi:hypothetical protein
VDGDRVREHQCVWPTRLSRQHHDTIWLLTTLTFNIIILYALIVRWGDSQHELQTR